MREIFAIVIGCWLLSGATAQGEVRSSFAMDSDPELKFTDPIIVYSKTLGPMCIKALALADDEMQQQAANALARAHRLGTPGLIAAVPALNKVVTAETTHPAARFAAAHALIVLEAKESAAVLFAVSQGYRSELRQLIEPALGKWNHGAVVEVWRKRLNGSEFSPREVLLAIQGLAQVRDEASVGAILAIAHDSRRPLATRLAAAKSVAQIQHSRLEEDAQQLLAAKSPTIAERVLAVSLLEHHNSEAAQTLLTRLAQDAEPAVATVGLRTLNAINHDLVLPLAEQAMLSQDMAVRQQGAAAFIARPTVERVTSLANLLDDPHPALRAEICEALFRLAAKPSLDSAVRQAATNVLGRDGWRGQEQATLLLASLDHKPAAARLLQLLESPRDEVLVVSAWGLRKLAVQETLPDILHRVRQQMELRLKAGSTTDAADAQVGHLCEALGLMKYEPADATLRLFVPKNHALGEFSRSGAIWALGYLHQGTPDEPLASLMVGRLTESPTAMPPEVTRVRIASAISIARMKAQSQVGRIRIFMGPAALNESVSLACRWAIQELTGESIPAPTPAMDSRIEPSFLESLE